MYWLADIGKILVAVIIGTVIGMERTKSKKPVGVRTLSMVIVGSTFASMIAINYFGSNAARVVGGIVTGIGFLGAGAIIAVGGDIKGLTTAATIWALAIVGVGIGVGEVFLASFVSLIIYFILIEGRLTKKRKKA